MTFTFLRIIAALTLCLSLNLVAQDRRTLPEHSKWVMDEELWEKSMKDLGKAQPGLKFKFLSAAQRGLRSTVRGNLFGIPAGELLIKGEEKGGAITGVTLSIFNRGDDRAITVEEMNRRFEKLSKVFTEKMGKEPVDRSRKEAVNLKSLMWTSGKSAFLLEKSVSGRIAEFMRLRVAPVNSARRETKTANRRHLSQNLVRDNNGDVWIDNIPMVDQGRKGYCACATAARIYQYYGLETTQHEIAQIAQAGPHTGTLPALMVAALKKVTTKLDSRVLTLYEYPKGVAETNTRDSKYLSGVREVNSDVNKYQSLAKKQGDGGIVLNGEKGAKVPRGYSISIFRARQLMKGEIYREVMVKKSNFSRFKSQIRKYVNEGVPIAWSLQLGMFPEKGLPQASGGHMRLIIGYNQRTKEVIYSDSWGAGHAKKRMPIADAYCMSNLLLALPPLH